MHLELIFLVLAIHLFADSVVDIDWSGKNKSILVLSNHIFNYILVWSIILFTWAVYNYVILNINIDYYEIKESIFWFFPITIVSHFIIDYTMYRLILKNKRLNNFIVNNTFQALHFTQLLVTIKWLLYGF